MLEKEVEKYLADRVKRLGGRAYKFISPGSSGVPDRLVCLPGGLIVFVELKAPGKTMSPLQRAQADWLKSRGHLVFVADSKANVDEVVSWMEGWIKDGV